MSTLHLVLKGKWFDMIASGEKKEEYREVGRSNEYWEHRLLQCHKDLYTNKSNGQCKKQQCFRCISECRGGEFKKFDTVTFVRAYKKNAPKMEVELKSISIGAAKPEWSDNWKGDVFIIKLGDILCKKNF